MPTQRFWGKIHIPGPYQIYHSRHEYLAAQADIKIAFTTDRCEVDYDIGDPPRSAAFAGQFGLFPKQGFEEKLAQLSQSSTIVFSFDSEIHPFHIDIWNQCHFDNVYWIAPGHANADKFINDRMIHWGSFFNIQRLMYQKLPDKLAEIKYTVPTPLFFDVLLGRTRPHRDFVYSAVNNSIKDHCIMTYFGNALKTKPGNLAYVEDFVWEPGSGWDMSQQLSGTHDTVE